MIILFMTKGSYSPNVGLKQVKRKKLSLKADNICFKMLLIDLRQPFKDMLTWTAQQYIYYIFFFII